MEQLSGLDASFISLETANAPMHIGGVSLLAGTTPGGRLDFDTFRAFLASRLHVSRTFTQRLAQVPLKLGKPYWEDVAEVDLDAHLERTQLPEPGGWKELSALMSWEFAQPLDRRRPLWHLLFVEGVDNVPGVPEGGIALIGRVHHAAIDGMSGAEILGALFDLSPEPRAIPVPERKGPETPVSRGKLLRRAGRNLLRGPADLRGVLGSAAAGLARSGAAWGLKRVTPPPLPFSAPRTRLNAPIGKRRTWSGALLDLERIKAIKNREGISATVNDVVLTVCAGALRRYLLEENELPEKPLVAMVPISVRGDEQQGEMGNQVSAMLVSLETQEDDPASRLRRIHEGTTRSKIHHQAIGARTLVDTSRVIPFSLAGMAARLYTGMGLAERHRPLFNVVITNVPGPQMPLYVAGSPLLAHVGAAPIFDGVGLILPIFSYAGKLAIGVTSCPEVMSDPERLARYLEEALDELERG